MRSKLDAFTWIVIGVVAILIVGALVTVSVSARAADGVAYLSGASPSDPVYNAVLAAQRGEIAKAREQFSQGVLDSYAKQGYDPITNAAASFANDQSARRVRIINVETVEAGAPAPEGVVTDSGSLPDLVIDPSAPQAYVTIAEDYFYSGGLLSRNTWSNRRIIRVVSEDGVWKVADGNLFY